MIRRLTVLFFLLFAAFPAGNALAHPHEFVTMRIAANFNESGHITGFLYNWTFDPFFTAYAVEGEDANKNGVAEQEELDKLLVEILGNIHSIDYFTAFDAQGVVPAFEKAIPVAAEMDAEKQLVITFDLPFTKAIDPRVKQLRYAIYDEEFYIAMTTDPDAKPVDLISAPAGCNYDLEDPEPDEGVADFAASLGKDQSGGSDLGVQFAEWVTITCK